MKFKNDTLVLIDTGGTSYIGKIKDYDSDYTLNLSDAFKVKDVNAITPEGMIMQVGTVLQPIIQGMDKPANVHVHICAISEINNTMQLYKNYEGIMAKCSGIILAPANALNNIKKIEL